MHHEMACRQHDGRFQTSLDRSLTNVEMTPVSKDRRLVGVPEVLWKWWWREKFLHLMGNSNLESPVLLYTYQLGVTQSITSQLITLHCLVLFSYNSLNIHHDKKKKVSDIIWTPLWGLYVMLWTECCMLSHFKHKWNVSFAILIKWSL